MEESHVPVGRELSSSQVNSVQELANQNKVLPTRYMTSLVDDEEEKMKWVNDDYLSSLVPVINLSVLSSESSSIKDKEEEMEKLKSALSSWGLFQAIGHGIPQNLTESMLTIQRQFFKLPIAEKQSCSKVDNGELDDLEGYGSDRIVSEDQVLDWCDRLYLLVEPQEQRKLNLWPQMPNHFRKTLHDYGVESSLVAKKVLKAVAELVGLEENYFINQMGKKAPAYARLNYYPPCSRPDRVYGLKAHTDGGVITIVLQDNEVEGLQVLKDDKWIKVPVISGALLINLGDLMEIMSNGKFKSPLHRVVTNAEKERISLVMFYSTEFAKDVEPAANLINDSNPRIFRKVKVKDYMEIFFPSYLQGKRALEWAKV